MRLPIILACAVVSIATVPVAAGPALAELASTARLAGDYVMAGKGHDPRDSAYSGTCSLRGSGNAYEVSCFNRDTRHTYVGKGLASGDTLSIFIGDRLRGDHGGVFVGEYLVVYRLRPDGVLDGTWVHADSAAAGNETLTPVR